MTTLSLDYTNCERSLEWASARKLNLYTELALADSRFWKRLTGPAIGTASALATLISNITYLFECIVKGAYNLAKGNGRLACKQLCDRLPHAIIRLALTPVYMVSSIALTTLGMLAGPDRYCYSRIKAHSRSLDPQAARGSTSLQFKKDIAEAREKASKKEEQEAKMEAMDKAFKKEQAAAKKK